MLFPIDWPEPFGLVMIEAFACGTPVLAFRRGSIAAGVFVLARHHAYPERFSRTVRPSTIRWVGGALIVGGFLLAFWDLLANAL